MIKGMNHVAASVSNLEKSLGFYRDLLRMEVVVLDTFEGEKYEMILGLKGARGKVALLRLGEMQIELFEFDHPRPKPSDPCRPVCDHGITHFCLEVKDIHGEYSRLKAAGVRFHCAPQEFFGTAIATYGRDPDGNVFEMLEMMEVDDAVQSGDW